MKIIAIYDNNEDTIDRYTVVTDWKDGNTNMMLGLSEGGDAISQWGSGIYEPNTPYDGLGKQIHFEDLSAATQEHIAKRVWGAE